MRRRKSAETAALDALIDDITVDADGEGEQVWAFLQALSDNVCLPCEAYVVGERLTLVGFDFDGNERRGLTAECRRPERGKYVVAAADIELPAGSEGGRYLAAYRRWMGLSPLPSPAHDPPVKNSSQRYAERPRRDRRHPG